MNDKISGSDPEAQRRAEKIKAIRRAIHSEAEVAPTTYENRADADSENTRPTEEPKSSSAEDILDELDEAIAVAKAEEERLAAEETAAAEKAAADAEISDIISGLGTPAQEELSEIAESITEDFSEVPSGITEDVMDFTEEPADVTEDNDAGAEEIPVSAAGGLVPEEESAEPEEESLRSDEELSSENEEPGADEDKETTQVFRAVSVAAAEEAEEEEEAPAEEAPAAEAEKLTAAEEGAPKKKKKKKSFKKRVRGLFPEKGDSVFEIIRKIVFLCSVIAIFVCGYLVLSYYYDLWTSKHKTREIMEIYEIYEDRQPQIIEEKTDEGEVRKRYGGMMDGARKLWDQNHEIVGVISIPDTPVNNPILQAENNEKYLDKKYDLTDNIAGELFLDYRNHFDDVGEDGYLKYPNSDNLVIYGHNMYDDQMFGCLKWYQRNENYYGEHPLIYLSSNYEKYIYKIFAFFILDASDDTETRYDCWNKLDFANEDEFYDFVNEAKKRSLRLNDVDVKYGDPLLTLSTCNTSLAADEERGRLIIMARRLRDGESPKYGTQNSRPNPNIKWPSLYYVARPNEKYDPNGEFVPYGPQKEDGR